MSYAMFGFGKIGQTLPRIAPPHAAHSSNAQP
jgi:hypothetical protein